MCPCQIGPKILHHNQQKKLGDYAAKYKIPTVFVKWNYYGVIGYDFLWPMTDQNIIMPKHGWQVVNKLKSVVCKTCLSNS